MFDLFKKRPKQSQNNEKANLSGYEYLYQLRNQFGEAENITNKALKKDEENNEE